MSQRIFLLIGFMFLFCFGGFSLANPHSPIQPTTPTDLGVVPNLYEKSRIDKKLPSSKPPPQWR